VDVAELARQIEDKVAPTPLIAVQALANTYSFEDDEERLLDPVQARDWLVESELAIPEVEVGERELQRLRDARETVRGLIDANLTGDVGDESRTGLGRLATQHPVELAVGDAGELSLDLTPQATVDAVLAQMTGIIFQAQLEGTWPRLKICASDECRWAFFDSSRNQGGTWCKMEVCGNRIKNRAYRRRNTAARRAR
jgi:predicted RNA-binding Zn ribbon-like protein